MSKQESKITELVNNPRQKIFLIRLTIFFLSIALLYFIYWFIYSRHYEETDNAYVNGNIIPVTTQIAGTIIAVKVNDTAFVQAGEPLALLDPTDRQIAFDRAKANLAFILRQTEQLYVKDKGFRATIDARKLTLKQANSDLKRRQMAINVGGISQEELNHAQDNFNIANSMLTTALSEWNANRALISGTSIKEHPTVLQAVADVKKAYLALLRTTIRSPVSGYIAKRSAQVGQVVAAGTPLMAVVPLDDVWIDANFKERQLRKIKPGQSVILTADIYGSSLIYHGVVVGFSGGTGSAFSLLPAQNATGNWIKIVQRLPVRINIDSQEIKKHPLRIGLSMEVTVNTASQSSLNNINSNLASTTDIFKNLDKGADKIIAKIFKDNLNENESDQQINNSEKNNSDANSN